ncbi:MAG: hypothetical protein SNG49_07855 [Rikenellaceae bacterium]
MKINRLLDSIYTWLSMSIHTKPIKRADSDDKIIERRDIAARIVALESKEASKYIWLDTDIKRLNSENPTKLDATLGSSRAIIYGTVYGIRKHTKINGLFNIVTGLPTHNYYIIQLDGVAIKSTLKGDIKKLSKGDKIYFTAKYSGERCTNSEYPLFTLAVLYSSRDRIEEYFVDQALNSPDEGDRYSYHSFSRNIYRQP